jgi:hypothetical protein
MQISANAVKSPQRHAGRAGDEVKREEDARARLEFEPVGDEEQHQRRGDRGCDPVGDEDRKQPAEA